MNSLLRSAIMKVLNFSAFRSAVAMKPICFTNRLQGFHALADLSHTMNLPRSNPTTAAVRHMNRNARRPKKPNHGKRPCSHARRRAKKNTLKSRAARVKIFGFWY